LRIGGGLIEMELINKNTIRLIHAERNNTDCNQFEQIIFYKSNILNDIDDDNREKHKNSGRLQFKRNKG
jgi:hypothetical protein